MIILHLHMQTSSLTLKSFDGSKIETITCTNHLREPRESSIQWSFGEKNDMKLQALSSEGCAAKR